MIRVEGLPISDREDVSGGNIELGDTVILVDSFQGISRQIRHRTDEAIDLDRVVNVSGRNGDLENICEKVVSVTKKRVILSIRWSDTSWA